MARLQNLAMRDPWPPLLLLLTGAALRLIGLQNGSPPGLEHDEVANWLIDRSILGGNHAIYFTQAYGHEAGFHYLQAGFVALLGDHALALRLPAAFAGLLLVAVTYALVRRLFGRLDGLVAAGITAVLFWPVFFSRLGLRAILLPLFSGLAACFWWQAWAGESPSSRRKLAAYALAGFFAGASIHTYMAARAVPIFFGMWMVYLLLWQRDALRARRQGVLLFWLVYAVVAAPLVAYLLTTPGAEYRIAEVDAPLRALLVGDWRPVLANGWHILAGFGWQGDPLWRQGVAGRPVFQPVLALCFYLGLLLLLWQWRTPRYGFVLLWLAVSMTPSLVTVDAPSTIRMINALPLLAVPLSRLIHRTFAFSTKSPFFSTKIGYFCLAAVLMAHIWGTAVAIFHTWPNQPEVQFVWQAALTDIGAHLDENSTFSTAAVAGWSPDTMDPVTMALTLPREDVSLSYFNPADGTLLLPAPAADGTRTLFRPNVLDLHPYWETWLAARGAVTTPYRRFTQYELGTSPRLRPQFPADVTFAGELRFLGHDPVSETEIVTYWEVVAVPENGTRLFVHLLDDAGRLLAEDYRLDTADPQNLWQPHWRPGDLILQMHELLPVPDATQIRIGVFNPYTCDPGPCQNLQTDAGASYILLPVSR